MRFGVVLIALLSLGARATATAATELPPALFAERDGRIVIEAEHAQDLGGYEIHEDAGASGGRYVSSGGRIAFRVLVHTRGRWRLFLRTRAEDDHGNSCFLFVDGEPIAAPEGIEHHHGVIQTTIGKWKWWNKWRESSNVVVTVDLTPGLHTIAFSPREPQQLDKICFLLGPGDGGLTGGLSGTGPAETGHAVACSWPVERDAAKLAWQARQGAIGKVLRKLRRVVERGEPSAAARRLQEELTAWLGDRTAAIEAAAARGDLVAAVDGVDLLADLAKGLDEVDAWRDRARAWRRDERYTAGTTFFKLVHQAQSAKGPGFDALLAEYRQHFPEAPYLRPGPWWFDPQ